MAPISTRTGTDLLDDALKNKTRLPSWKSVFSRISAPSAPSEATITSIAEFLASPSSLNALSNCYNLYPSPSPASKIDFEKRTAPINFTAADQPNGNKADELNTGSALPGIAEVKEAALQLSKELEIDEVSALRIVVMEYQNRSTEGLISEDANVRNGTENTLMGGNTEDALDPSDLISDAEKKEMVFISRLKIYLKERRYVIKTATFLIRAALGKTKEGNVWKDLGRRFVSEGIVGNGGMAKRTLETISRRWVEVGQNGERLPGWIASRMKEEGGNGQDMLYGWEKQTLWETIHLLQLLFLVFYKPTEETSAPFVIAWFNFMKESKFMSEKKFLPFPEAPDIVSLYDYIVPIVSILSVAILQLPRVGKHFEEEIVKLISASSSATPPANAPAPPPQPTYSDGDFYIKSPQAIKAITDCLKETSQIVYAGPVGICWVLILEDIKFMISENTVSHDVYDESPFGNNRRISRHPTVEFYDDALSQLFDTRVEMGIRLIAQSTNENMSRALISMLDPSVGVAPSNIRFSFDAEEDGRRMKNVAASLIRKAIDYCPLTSDLFTVAVALNEIPYNELAKFKEFLALEEETGWAGNHVKKFWEDLGGANLLNRTRHRFPHEPLPFLKLIRGLATEERSAIEYLTKMTSYTQVLPASFREYDILDDEDDRMRIYLSRELVLFSPRRGGIYDNEGNGFGNGGGIVIPEGTQGVVISEGSSRPVVAWRFEYNALTLFGRILECALLGSGTEGKGVIGELGNQDAIMEIVGLFTILIASGNSEDEIQAMLAEASDECGRSRDVISIVFDLLEEALQATQNSPNTSRPTEFIVTAMEFVDALIPVLPGRVWPYLSRSTLLEHHGRGGAFAGILSAVEVVRGQYEFTISCLNLFENLVEEAIRKSVIGMGGNRSLVLSKGPSNTGPVSGVSSAVQTGILEEWTKVIVDVFESYRGFKYEDKMQMVEIGTRIARVFTKILDLVYGIDDTTDLNSKITSVLAPSAEHIVKVFISESANEMPFEPIVGAVWDGVQTPENSLLIQRLGYHIDHVVAVLRFSEKCVRVRGYLGFNPSQHEKHLYGIAAPLAKLYAIHEQFRHPVLELLESLVIISGGVSSTEPPSLLGHLGTECASNFTALLGNLDKPFDDLQLESRIWGFVSAIISNKQQGMSILMLRGETLSQGGVNGKPKNNTKSLLSIALDAISNIDKLSTGRAFAILTTVALAQNYWSLAMEDLGNHERFFPAIVKHIDGFNIEFLPADSKEIITEKANRVAVSAQIAQILAMHLNARRPSARDGVFFKKLIPTLRFYFEHAVRISGYRNSLHTLLQKNFEEKWPGLSLRKVKKTELRRRDYGPDYYYDMELCGKILGSDPSWNGRADGYANEVEQANLNFTLIDSQVLLMRSWRLLALELCDFVKANKELERPLAGVVESCLSANIECGLPPPIFNVIICERAEFGFVIMRRLQQSVSEPGDLFDRTLELAWTATHKTASEFRIALANADAGYYRSLLRIIYLALDANSSKPRNSTKTAYMILDILTLVVTEGFKDLAAAAHSHPDTANPEDIALVTAILQAALRLKGMDVIHAPLSTHLADNGTIRAATTLFSWAEQLAYNGDPVYGELSVLFLLELSSVPLIANQLAVEGILELLTNSSLSARIRQGVAPTSEPRLHVIWSKGMLPIALNLLFHIGHRIGKQVVAFLKYFAPQLQNTVASWQKPTIITLSAINEATTIVMIMTILAKMGGSAESQGIKFDKPTLMEGVDYLLSHKNYMATLVVATSIEEQEMMRRDASDGDGNELVEKAVNGMVMLQGLLGDEDGEE